MVKLTPLILDINEGVQLLNMSSFFVPVGVFSEADLVLAPLDKESRLTKADGTALPAASYLVSRYLSRNNELACPEWLEAVLLPRGEYMLTTQSGVVPPGQKMLVWVPRP
jgi:hypothetical protein